MGEAPGGLIGAVYATQCHGMDAGLGRSNDLVLIQRGQAKGQEASYEAEGEYLHIAHGACAMLGEGYQPSPAHGCNPSHTIRHG